MKNTVRNFKRHATEMANQFDISLVLDPELPRHAAGALSLNEDSLHFVVAAALGIKPRVVHARPIDDETSYVVVMHEIGHFVAPNGISRLPMPTPPYTREVVRAFCVDRLISEEAAWEWAQHFIEQVFIWTAGMEAVKQYGLGTYLEARRLAQ